MTGDQAQITAEQAKILVEQDSTERAKRCGEAFTRVLKKYNCRLSIMTVIQDGRVTQKMDIIPN